MGSRSDFQDLSPALELLQATWNGCNSGGWWSWRNYNARLRDTIHLAVRGRFRFDLEDFTFIDEHFRPGFWLTWHEGLYGEAIRYQNQSCIAALEHYLKRDPFIIQSGGYYRGDWRLHVGCTLYWVVPPTEKMRRLIKLFRDPVMFSSDNMSEHDSLWLDEAWRNTPKPCRVSSFDDQNRLVLCWRRDPQQYGRPERVFRVTRQEFLAERKARPLKADLPNHYRNYDA